MFGRLMEKMWLRVVRVLDFLDSFLPQPEFGPTRPAKQINAEAERQARQREEGKLPQEPDGA